MTTPEEHIDRAIEETTAALADGLDVSDLAVLVRNGVEIADQLDDVPGPKKRELALSYASELLDEFWTQATPKMQEAITAIDIPWVPEGIEAALVDPLLARYLPELLKGFAKQSLPAFVDLVIDASRGGVQVNTELWTKAASIVDFIAKHGEQVAVALDLVDDGEGSNEREAIDALAALRSE